MAVIIFLDLSKPDELWSVLESTLDSLRQALDEAIKSKGNMEAMKTKAWERIGGAEHKVNDVD